MTVTKYKPSNLTTNKPSRDTGPGIDAFVKRTRALQATTRAQAQRGRLIFALDATYSRQATWDLAMQKQVEMYEEVSSNLDVQFVYYRGFGECQATGWVSSSARLAHLMSEITCRAGKTQIGKVLKHARSEAEKASDKATPPLVFISDACEENIDELAATAAELGRLGVKAFMFQERNANLDDAEQAKVETVFREIARLSGGAYCRFDANAPHQLSKLLRAVAAFAVGGVKALAAKPGALKLLEQLK
jgi:hypothetical protein